MREEVPGQAVFSEALPEIGRFGSIGINYVLHCLPGSISEKAVVFDRLATALEADGVLFGSTILASDGTCSLAARATMALFNRRGIFCNGRDRLPDLVAALGARFDDVRCWRVGHVALFEARGPVATRSAA